MATIAQLDAEIAAALEALPTTPVRLLSDYDDDTGEVMPRDSYRYRLRLDATEMLTSGSNRYEAIIQAQADLLVRMSATPPLPPQERDYRDVLNLDQQALIVLSFWQSMVAVKEVVPGTTPQVVEVIARVGDVLWYQVAVDLVLD